MTEDNSPKLNNKLDPINVFGITFFLTLGFVFLLNIVNILPWGVWSIILRFWPIFLILLIIQIFGRKYKIAYSIIAATGIGLIISIVFFSFSQVNSRIKALSDYISPQLKTIRGLLGIELGQRLTSNFEILSKDFPDVKKREINVNIPAGEFSLTDNTEPTYFTAKANYYEKFGKPRLISRLKDGTLITDFEAEKSLKPALGGAEDVKYNISIGNPEIIYDLGLNTGAANFNAKFSNPNLNSLGINVGVGGANVFIGDNALPRNKIEAQVGAGSLKVRLPFNTFAKINYEVDAGVLVINNNNFNRSGSYTTPNFRVETEPLTISVKIVAGTVVIDSSGKEEML